MSEYRPPPGAVRPSADAAQVRKPSRPKLGRFLVIWVLLPCLYAGGFALWGMHLGAREPEAWYTRAARFVLGDDSARVRE